MVLLELPDVKLDTRSCHRLASFSVETQALKQPLGLSGVGFIFDSPINPANHAIQNCELLRVIKTWSKPTSFLQLVLLLEKSLEPVNFTFRPSRCEVVAVNNDTDVLLWWTKIHGEATPCTKPASKNNFV